MNTPQKESWTALKLAVDKYSQATGAEVAVATTFFPSALNDNYQSHNDAKPKTSVYGHGNLSHKVQKAMDFLKGDENAGSEWITNETPNITIDNAQSIGRQPNSQDPMARSLSSSFRTLKLDMRSSLVKSGASGSSMGTSPIGSSPDRDYKASPIQTKSGRRKNKRKKAKAESGEFELDENLMFGEGEAEQSSEEDDSLEDSDESEEGMPGNLPPHHFFNPPLGGHHRPPVAQNFRNGVDHFATSLPVNIHLAWGHHNDAPSRFRDNQGPHPPTFNQPMRAGQNGPKIIQAEKTPQLDTMMASMQALARSVTDDSAMIFGERPRPRIHNETSKNRNFKI